ncbi:hypothetical protein HGRIS_003407 [Hohenbuehelia grisea]|uniref:Uncharacterized protein n=1 Tax=Hohenbuehelia grisea TaxID=104357 RepID=A0ABR3JFC4_9AGAR
MPSAEEKVAKFKAEGNALFGAKKYREAVSKYSDALQIDASNAVILANRSACRLALGRYVDAADDAKRATESDPLYAKGWARLAAANDALGQHTPSIDAWQRAIDALPKENLSPAEVKQRETYVTNLDAAKNAQKKVKETPIRGIHVKAEDGKKLPWVLAEALLPDLQARQEVQSSAWVIALAHQEFKQAVDVMKAQKMVTIGGVPSVMARVEVITEITNGLLRDTRAFYMDDPRWLQLYNTQVQYEIAQTKAWVDGSAKEIMSKAKARLRQEGWDSVRPALALTIRAYFMRGFLDANLRQRYDLGADFIGRAIELIKLGRAEWHNVGTDRRGVVFEDTVSWGMRTAGLEILRLSAPFLYCA